MPNLFGSLVWLSQTICIMVVCHTVTCPPAALPLSPKRWPPPLLGTS